MNKTNTHYIYLPRLLDIANTILFIVSIILLLLCTFAAEVLTESRRTSTGDTPQTYGMHYEEATLSAREDGLEIAAWYIPVEERARSESRRSSWCMGGLPAARSASTSTSCKWRRSCTRLAWQ